MNVNFGLLPPLANPPRDKKLRNRMYADRALEAMASYIAAM
jgi:folate-dependent tRNA-U54 methylase TrmFO/GidA